MKTVPSVRIELRRSPLAGAFIVVTHLATAALLAWLPMDAPLRAICAITTGAHALWAVRSSALRSLGSSIVAAELAPDRRVTLICKNGRRIDGCALVDSYVGERLVTLVMRQEGSRRTRALWLLPDMAPQEDLRRFRVLLRLSRPVDDT
jgi:hypothetical protein